MQSDVNAKKHSAVKKIALFAIAVIIVAAITAAIIYNSAARPKKNVILIILDTLRADKLGCYGNTLGLTPNIDKFAQNASLFKNAFSQAPWTLPSIASMYTSRYPIQHGAGGRLGSLRVLPEQAVTIAEVFNNAGANTHAIVNVVLMTQNFGMHQGFDSVDAVDPENNLGVRRAEPTNKAALEWIDSHREKPFFLLLHYFDAHMVYDPPQPFRSKFAHPQDKYSNDYIFGTHGDMLKLRLENATLPPEKIERLEKLHNGEIAYLDSQIGNLLAELTQRELDSETVIVITADHGEEFGDHGGIEHAHTLYDELIHVPLIIRTPDTNSPSVVPTNVRLIDIAPTLCDLTGLDSPPSFIGKSLIGLLNKQPEPDRPILSHANMWGPTSFAWREGTLKIIRQVKPERIELFDTKTDPAEKKNITDVNSQIRNDMLAELNLILETAARSAQLGKTPKLTPQETEKLRSLGYLN